MFVASCIRVSLNIYLSDPHLCQVERAPVSGDGPCHQGDEAVEAGVGGGRHLYRTVQYSTAQYSAVQHAIVWCITPEDKVSRRTSILTLCSLFFPLLTIRCCIVKKREIIIE